MLTGDTVLHHAKYSASLAGRCYSDKTHSETRFIEHCGDAAAAATDIAPEEIAFCTDTEGKPVALGRGSWGRIYLAMRWGTQARLLPPLLHTCAQNHKHASLPSLQLCAARNIISNLSSTN